MVINLYQFIRKIKKTFVFKKETDENGGVKDLNNRYLV